MKRVNPIKGLDLMNRAALMGKSKFVTRLDKYIIFSLLKIGLSTILLTTLMMLMVELFANFSLYSGPYMNAKRTLYLLLLRCPYAINLTIGPAFLFATTFFVSSIYSNNELIALLSAGIPYKRIVIPIASLGLVLSIIMFLFGEFVLIPSNVKYKTTVDMYQNNDISHEADNSNIFYVDRNENLIIKANRYTDKRQELSDVELILKGEDGSLEGRYVASSALWDEVNRIWVLNNVVIYDVDLNNFSLEGARHDTYTLDRFRIEPSFFKNVGTDIKTMPLSNAIDYLRNIKLLSISRYNELATDFYERIFSCLTVLVMIIVSISINLRFRKNVLLFSILAAISLAVIYYVVQIMTLLVAKQGMIAPIFGMMIPFIVILAIAGISASTIRS